MEKFVIVSSTHWDREWYRTARDYRIQLCELMLEALDLLEKDYCCYTTDGQTIMVEDFLDVYPQQRPRVQRLVKEGKLSIGPWYTLLDEYLVSGESIIRNLMAGDAFGREMGGKLTCGYIPDTFGHISQLPQIFKSAGFDIALFYRGINLDRSRKNEFHWQGADGTVIMAEHLVAGYWNLKSWGLLGKGPVEHFTGLWRHMQKRSDSGCYLMINGSDHLYPQPELAQHIEMVKKAYPEIEVVQGSIRDFADEVHARLAGKQLPLVIGELRDEKDAQLHTSSGSNRAIIKQMNFVCQRELERYAEPLAAISHIQGGRHWPEFLNRSWMDLMKNHTHDSIYSSSHDDVILDVQSRYRHSLQTSQKISALAIANLAGGVDTSGLAQNERYLLVFNPLGWNRIDKVTATVSFPAEDGIRDITLMDEHGRDVPFEYLSISDTVELRESLYVSKEKLPVKRFEISFAAPDVPAMGYACYKAAGSRFVEKRRQSQYRGLHNFRRGIENEYYSIGVNADGTLRITNRISGCVYDNMHLFEDRGDAGNGFQYAAPFRDAACYPMLASMSVEHNSPHRSALRLKWRMDVPKSLDAQYFGRTTETEEMVISSEVTLYAGVNRIDFETIVANPAVDHILTVKFPTGIKAGAHYAHIPFDVVRRGNDKKIVQQDDNECATPFHPMQLFAGICGAGRAVTFTGQGLHEYQVKDSGCGQELIVTLLRSVRWLFREVLPLSKDGQPCTTPVVYTPEAAALGETVLRYSLVLHTNDAVADGVYMRAYEHAYPLRCAEIRDAREGALPLKHSFLSLDNPKIVLSAMKVSAGGGIILRLYNITGEPQQTIVGFAAGIKNAYYCNVLEQRQGSAKLKNGALPLSFGKKQIMTLELILDEMDTQ